MSNPDLLPLLILGSIFALVGLIAIILWIRENRRRDIELVQRWDLREYMTHWPERAWLQAWRIGSWVSLLVGLVLLGAAVWVMWSS